MQNINTLAEKIQQNIDGVTPTTNYDPTYSEYQEVLVDPVSIALVSTIILNVIKLIQGCKKNQTEATQVSHNPNLFQRRALKREIRKEVGGGIDNEALRNKYYNAIRQEGTQITEFQMGGLYDDYSGYTTMQYRTDNSSYT